MKDFPNSGWAEKPLGEVVTVTKTKGGGRPLPYVGLEDISSDGTGEFTGSLEPQGDKSTTFEFGPRHLLYGRLRPYLNKVYRPDFEGHCSSEIFPMLPDERLDRGYLFHWITSDQVVEKINATSTGARMPRANVKEILEFPIPVPPLEEQQRIVAVLDEAFEGLARARAHAETNLQNARDLFTACLRSLFSDNREDWPLRNISDVCIEFGRGKSRHRPRNDPRLFGGDMPFVQTGDLSKADHFLRDFTQTYSVEGIAQSRVWPKGTVCVAIVGATIGESAILEFDACFPDSVIGMVPDPEEADSEFLDFLLQFVKADLKEAGKGSARDNINLGTFSDRLFPIPELKAQRAAIEKISEIDRESRRLSTIYTTNLADIDDLRQSLLQKAFAGELT
ncbi:restriction endonuclease subunit S [uncultured Tateyamaria sp.]|uniref:restriction endonuclease subunit S n=1 Tax=uncultured Tateyamaria sp. TaxID=455651 RepID=UPI0026295393|nr:restriction endonuclease subunit S [uncultured Tateyamaria sp.]